MSKLPSYPSNSPNKQDVSGPVTDVHFLCLVCLLRKGPIRPIGYTQTFYVAEDELELLGDPVPPCKSWDYRHMPCFNLAFK